MKNNVTVRKNIFRSTSDALSFASRPVYRPTNELLAQASCVEGGRENHYSISEAQTDNVGSTSTLSSKENHEILTAPQSWTSGISRYVSSYVENIKSALSYSGAYEENLLKAKSNMLFKEQGHGAFTESLRVFFDTATSHELRDECLSSLDVPSLKSLLKSLQSLEEEDTNMSYDNREIVLRLLHAVVGKQKQKAAYKKKLKEKIFLMHTDRGSPFNKDFSSKFRNIGRDLLWTLLLYLSRQCDNDGLFCENNSERCNLTVSPKDTLTDWIDAAFFF